MERFVRRVAGRHAKEAVGCVARERSAVAVAAGEEAAARWEEAISARRRGERRCAACGEGRSRERGRRRVSRLPVVK
jgi:hypothetical protein